MNYRDIYNKIVKKNSFLCVGLDTDIEKIPECLLNEEDPVFEFNKRIVDATQQFAVAYKPNTAFYEALGAKGWTSLQKTAEYIKKNYPGIFLIADCKRGDIGNTCKMYAKTFFEQMPFDAVTLSPYMGRDSISPFLEYEGKWAIILALTSNPSASDFQIIQEKETDEFLFEKTLKFGQLWGDENRIMYVAGATQAYKFQQIRKIAKNNFLLVPGVGAQGGSLEDVATFGMNETCGLLVNSSRGIIYASNGSDFAEKAGEQAEAISIKMKKLLEDNKKNSQRK
ncbi:MAG: orotidine-5'-phosphate decarboxylase [Bacteroidales bacterium]|jgi:orotidine-5'-phosphate decarboxylase|nr:orotidine-5'-phosphate decarboxylase [Bacteroidales bacterium]MBR6278042.1 orotidine-5'-phosphate decarboxylase [Bacteroidales bacterium]